VLDTRENLVNQVKQYINNCLALMFVNLGIGTYPILWGIGVSTVIAFIEIKLVGGAMHRDLLIKG
jgi:hypothetical protein